MSLKGKLETFYLASLLQLLANDQKTGVLEVSDGEDKVKVFVKDGIILYATSSQKELRLGRLLKIKGIISEEQLKKSINLGEEKKKKLGNVLVEEGYVSKETLKNILQHQVKEILYGLFLWETGEFEYKDVPLKVAGEMVTKLNAMEIILEASRRIDEWSIITKQIENDKLVFKMSDRIQDKDEVKLNKDEWSILSLIDGTRTVRQIVKNTAYDEFVVYKILYSLTLSGLIEKRKQSNNPKKDFVDYSVIISMYNDIFQVIRKSIGNEIGKGVFNMFDECKAELVPNEGHPFRKFDMRKDPDANMQSILDVMNTFHDFDKGRIFLIHTFNSLLLNILDKEIKMVGTQIVQRTLKEIDQIFSYIKEYQKESTQKLKIIHEIEEVVLTKIIQQIEDENIKKKRKYGGIFSVFRIK